MTIAFLASIQATYVFVSFAAGTCPTKPVLKTSWQRKLIQGMDAIECFYLIYSIYRVKLQSISLGLNSA